MYTDTAVRSVTLLHRYGNSQTIRDRTVLPAIRQSWHPAFSPAEAATRFSDSGGLCNALCRTVVVVAVAIVLKNLFSNSLYRYLVRVAR